MWARTGNFFPFATPWKEKAGFDIIALSNNNLMVVRAK